jgi:hypothetical protein
VLTNNRERKPKAETKTQSFVFSNKRQASSDALDGKNFITTKKQQMLPTWEEPAAVRHEFGEPGSVNMSIEVSATFTVMEHETLSCMFAGELSPDQLGHGEQCHRPRPYQALVLRVHIEPLELLTCLSLPATKAGCKLP